VRRWWIRQGQAVVAELRHEYERGGDVDVSNIDVPVLMRGEWLHTLSKNFLQNQ
jgi:hypothetical protein